MVKLVEFKRKQLAQINRAGIKWDHPLLLPPTKVVGFVKYGIA